MQINVKLYGSLRDLAPAENRGKMTLELSPNAIVQDVLDTMGIDDYVIVAVNDEHNSNTQTRLHAHDRVMIFEASAGG